MAEATADLRKSIFCRWRRKLGWGSGGLDLRADEHFPEDRCACPTAGARPEAEVSHVTARRPVPRPSQACLASVSYSRHLTSPHHIAPSFSATPHRTWPLLHSCRPVAHMSAHTLSLFCPALSSPRKRHLVTQSACQRQQGSVGQWFQ
jgi:hypothetical protein